MAAATMEIGGRTEGVSGQTYFFYAPLFLPLFILGVPIADMAFAYVRRVAKGTGIDTPDNDHVHHRLVRLGHGPRRTVVILWTWTAALSGFVLFPLVRPGVQRHHPLRVHRARPAAVHLVPPGTCGNGAPRRAQPRRHLSPATRLRRQRTRPQNEAADDARQLLLASKHHCRPSTPGAMASSTREPCQSERPASSRKTAGRDLKPPSAELRCRGRRRAAQSFKSRGRRARERSATPGREPPASVPGRHASSAR